MHFHYWILIRYPTAQIFLELSPQVFRCIKCPRYIVNVCILFPDCNIQNKDILGTVAQCWNLTTCYWPVGEAVKNTNKVERWKENKAKHLTPVSLQWNWTQKEKLSKFATRREFPYREILLGSREPECSLFRRDTHHQGPHTWDSILPGQCMAVHLFHRWGLGRLWGCSSPSHGHRSTGHIQSWPTACHAAGQNTKEGKENTFMNPAATESCKCIFSLSSPPYQYVTLLSRQPSQALYTVALTSGCATKAKIG